MKQVVSSARLLEKPNVNQNEMRDSLNRLVDPRGNAVENIPPTMPLFFRPKINAFSLFSFKPMTTLDNLAHSKYPCYKAMLL